MPISIIILSLALAADVRQSANPGEGREAAAATTAPDATVPSPASVTAIDRLIGHGMQIGDPFPTRDSMEPMPSTSRAAKAQSIVRLARIARDRGLDRSDDFVRTMAAVSDMLLAEKLMQSLSNAIVIDEREVRETFDRYPDKYDEFELAHIFFSSGGPPASGTEADKKAFARASKAEARLKAGEDFSRIASAESDDKESAGDGGVLPTILGNSIQPAFLGAVAALRPDGMSGIVKGDQGYHIIKLLKRTHQLSGPPRDLIEREIKMREMQKLVPELKRMEEMAR